MPLEVRLRPAAQSDVSDVWEHSVQTWGEARANRYLSGLNETLELIAEFPEMARLRSVIDPPVRIHPYKSHVIIYRSDTVRLDVMAIKHNRSNWAALLAR